MMNLIEMDILHFETNGIEEEISKFLILIMNKTTEKDRWIYEDFFN